MPSHDIENVSEKKMNPLCQCMWQRPKKMVTEDDDTWYDNSPTPTDIDLHDDDPLTLSQADKILDDQKSTNSIQASGSAGFHQHKHGECNKQSAFSISISIPFPWLHGELLQ